ncbi:hypothetical protein MRB53_015471 [Persea americana]|uniref:Uncharacterized protein n=1 Tax=Persea americana TaxID=3435 RepID=A0ACC2M0P0_PERAE|nr:hypothetical protein MRB53_015471 [Persea americana]
MSRLQCHYCGRQWVLSRGGEEVVVVGIDKEEDGDEHGVVGVEGNGCIKGKDGNGRSAMSQGLSAAGAGGAICAWRKKGQRSVGVREMKSREAREGGCL